jgi:hypothetical protein
LAIRYRERVLNRRRRTRRLLISKVYETTTRSGALATID